MQETLLDTVFSPVKVFCHNRMWSWIKGENIFPITMEMGISGAGNCNNRCTFCMHRSYYQDKAEMDFKRYSRLVCELGGLGIKGMIFSGSGECLVHPGFVDFVEVTKEMGIDVAVVTNGSALGKLVIPTIIKNVSWVRVSLDAGTPETRESIHGIKNDFYQVLHYLDLLSWEKQDAKSNCQIGAQMVVTKQNWLEIPLAVSKVQETGIDYFQIKPVVYHIKDGRKQLDERFIKGVLKLSECVKEEFERENFKVYIKYDQFEALLQPNYDRDAYDVCRATFFPIIEATGKVYHCSQTRGMEEFEIGDIYKNTFKEIWNSPIRKEIIANINPHRCTPVCRCHYMNRLLKSIALKENSPSFV